MSSASMAATTTRLHVSGLAPDVTDADLRTLFAKVGRVASASIARSRFEALSRGFGYVDVAADAAAACIKTYDNATWRAGMKLGVAPARPTFAARLAAERAAVAARAAKRDEERAERRAKTVARDARIVRDRGASAALKRGRRVTRFPDVAAAPPSDDAWAPVPRPPRAAPAASLVRARRRPLPNMGRNWGAIRPKFG